MPFVLLSIWGDPKHILCVKQKVYFLTRDISMGCTPCKDNCQEPVANRLNRQEPADNRRTIDLKLS